MRDYVVTAIVFGFLPFILRSPVLGAYVWVWLSMMNPHKAAFGFAYSMPFAFMVATATVIGMLAGARHRKPLPTGPIIGVIVAMLLWMSITSLFALNPETDQVIGRWEFVMKIHIMIFVTMMLIRGRKHLDTLIWVTTFSVGFYGIKGGIYTVMSGGGGRVWGPTQGMIEDNNALAVALIMLLPMMFYLFQTAKRKWVRILLIGSMVTTTFSVLGSQSRGALLGVFAMALYLAVKSRYPVRMSVVLFVLLGGAVAFMPASWNERMDTIGTYQTDASAMSRLYVWQTMWNAAVDRPLVGAGFLADNVVTFQRYGSPRTGSEGFEETVLVAHSIYFQMLGEHGFPGLALFLILGVLTWRTAGRLTRQTRGDPDFGDWVPLLMPMIQVSMIGFAVGGAFLSLAYFDLPYYFVAVVVLVNATIKERDRARNALASASLGAAEGVPPTLPVPANRGFS